MKTAPLAVLVAIAGLACGGGAAFGTSLLLSKPATPEATEAAVPTFVPTGKILAPLVFSDGRLSGYVNFQVQLQVSPEKAEFVTARLPVLLHGINMRTYRSPMASGPDGMLPDLAVFRRVVMTASGEAFGSGIVKSVAITEATPA